MLQFLTLETFVVTGRGMGHVVTNAVEKPEAQLIDELVGATVLLDGREVKIKSVESWLVPGKVIKAGEPIAFVV